MDLLVHPFVDPHTRVTSYLLVNPGSRSCAVIDPACEHADAILELVSMNALVVEWILQTGLRADGCSAARDLKRHFICAQTARAKLPDAAALDDAWQVDRELAHDERLCLGHTCGRVVILPHAAPGACCFVYDDLAFVGDALASGAGSLTGDCADLRRLRALPPATRLLGRVGARDGCAPALAPTERAGYPGHALTNRAGRRAAPEQSAEKTRAIP